MAGYRCYLLDSEDHILQAHELECDTDGEAASAAEDLMRVDPYHHGAEVWQRKRRIVVLHREQVSRAA